MNKKRKRLMLIVLACGIISLVNLKHSEVFTSSSYGSLSDILSISQCQAEAGDTGVTDPPYNSPIPFEGLSEEEIQIVLSEIE
jgi:hypothetical protein